MDIDSIRSWCSANRAKLNISKARVSSFTSKTNMAAFEYKLCGSLINRTDTIKDLGVSRDSKRYFHYVDYIYIRKP
jgi:hypothetical protein